MLPTGVVTFIVLVIGEPRDGEPGCGVALPSSASFTGQRLGGEPERFEISRLDGGWAEEGGTVELSDGTRLRAVNMVPTPICRELTDIQKRIAYWTIKLIDAEGRCYRYGPPTPDLAFLDYGKVYDLKLPTLKAIAHYIARQDFTFRKASHQTIANALSACGLRRPRSGRLAN